ncbi:MAG TPA: hypothetical protein VFI34_02645 [Candidatus Limnocylindrales bacterium]|nr:hypothetical protein [Candidatus Limnocylindrales bacterium]
MVRRRSGHLFSSAARQSSIALIVAGVLAGCSGFPGATDPVAARDRAHAVLDRWAHTAAGAGAASAVTPVGELTAQIGDWEEAVGENNKIALMSGMIGSPDGLSATRPPDGAVTWADGTTTNASLLSPQEALAAISAGSQPCSDCTGLVVTGARVTSGPIETTRGSATAPLWEFSLAGTAVKVTRVALANSVVVEPMFDGNPELGLAIDSAEGSVSGSELTLAFIGAPDGAEQSCGEDYTAEAIESDLAVVVIVTRHPHFPPLGGGCSAVGARRTATATLAAPLGERVVLDLQLGTPVRIELAP